MDKCELHLGDCLAALKTMPDNSLDSLVTDPPAGISFMEKEWDQNKGGRDSWIAWMSEVMTECLRVLKPGAHGLVWAIPRTSHWTATALENAGFEVRDVVNHLFGSGFPKSLNISKAIDKRPKAKLQEFSAVLKAAREKANMSLAEADTLITGGTSMYCFLEGRNVNGSISVYPPNKKFYEKIKTVFSLTGWDDIVENNLEVIDEQAGNFGYQKNGERWENKTNVTDTTTSEAKQWEGWGSALKPACENWILVRKPIEGSIAANVLKWGVGGLNIDGCRIESDGYTARPPLSTNKHSGWQRPWNEDPEARNACEERREEAHDKRDSIGRFPANLILDETAAAMLDVQSEDLGGASRFFYVAKAPQSEKHAGLDDLEAVKVNDGRDTPIDNPFQRGETLRKNTHPTVKSVKLMTYLCRLVTPPGGTLLDPFMGSGSTGIAAINEGFRFVGVEQSPEYYGIAEKRLKHAKVEAKSIMKPLFAPQPVESTYFMRPLFK